MLRKVIFLVLSASLSGCAATAMRLDYGEHRCPYIGLRLDWWLVGESNGKLIPFLLIDAPFSFVVDTVFFPFEYQYIDDCPRQ
ncbi:YceK/YidQ family lipoprotein [Pseudomonas sp. MPR-ANC1]|uniref:YceK/YidQ family lipoprotein n=1 Tax=Pseudomonas sp. MPR-ANC1 TaxID=2075548 RepID=UPI000CD0E857|nr:YceK/YidQ family lipoprotein [Pseudomonas sp. MPR-ANC1]POA47122.1 YceK/YidQ family lipoprotein [Pseudomonas sp. MPR-ANC1]